jgi:hypothetical protein
MELRDIEGSGEPAWEGWRVTDCLTERYSTDAGEDETLTDLEGDSCISSQTRKGPKSSQQRKSVLSE